MVYEGGIVLSKAILVIDDEKNIRELIEFNLEEEGYKVFLARDGKEGLEKITQYNIDLIILDLMLPEVDGLSVCRQIRGKKNTKNIPIIMLTAKGEEVDRILGLEMGADDYITKPFSPRELLARIKAIFRRMERIKEDTQKNNDNRVYEKGEIILDLDSHMAFKNDERVDLTPKEFELLRYFMINDKKVLTRDILLEKIWGYEYAGDTRTVDVHIRRLRQKIGREYIVTVRGVGYKFAEME